MFGCGMRNKKKVSFLLWSVQYKKQYQQSATIWPIPTLAHHFPASLSILKTGKIDTDRSCNVWGLETVVCFM